jgi:hypothetical protein
MPITQTRAFITTSARMQIVRTGHLQDWQVSLWSEAGRDVVMEV